MLHKGDRVRGSAEGLRVGAISPAYREGTCVSDEYVPKFSRRAANPVVSVLWDHRKSSDVYSVNFVQRTQKASKVSEPMEEED